MSVTRFKTNWKGVKKCKECLTDFFATSGSRRFCNECIFKKTICPECGNDKSLYDSFCGLSCAGKWNQKNNPNVRTIDKNRLSVNRGISISKARLGKPRYDMRGNNNFSWKGGTYGTERHRLMGQVEYKNWRRAVFERDDWTCRICKQRGGKLNAHHIIYYAIDKNKALDLKNGMTVCKMCHLKIHNK